MVKWLIIEARKNFYIFKFLYYQVRWHTPQVNEKSDFRLYFKQLLWYWSIITFIIIYVQSQRFKTCVNVWNVWLISVISTKSIKFFICANYNFTEEL